MENFKIESRYLKLCYFNVPVDQKTLPSICFKKMRPSFKTLRRKFETFGRAFDNLREN